VSDTTSTPDEHPKQHDSDQGDPDQRATVATDEQAIRAGAGAGAPAGSAAGNGHADGGNGRDPGARPTGGGPPVGSGGDGAPSGGDGAPSGGDRSSGAAPADDARERTVVDAKVPSPTSRPGSPEASTTEMRLPANGSAAGAAPVRDAPTEQGMRPTGASSGPGAPAPAPGPVPGPGPDAATPPPWHRTPGRSHTSGSVGPQRHEPAAAGGLLDEGPTAFLRAPEATRDDDRDAGGRSPVRASRNRPPRQAALQLRRLDPWSVLKLALVLAAVLFFVWLVAVGVLYGVLDGIGVWDRLNGTYADLVSGETQTGAPLISAGRVFGFAAVVGAINSLLFAVAVTIAAFVYNVSADLVGGIEVTLSERD